MLIPFLSDNQCDEYSQFSHFLSSGPYKGMNSRLAHCLEAISTFEKYLEDNGCEIAVLGGDLFDGIGRLKITVLSSVYEAVAKLANGDRQVVKVLGNHGRGDFGLDDHASRIFEGLENFEVVSKTKIIRPAGDPKLRLCFVAFHDNNDELAASIGSVAQRDRKKGDRSILILHNAVRGGRVGNEGYAPEGFLDPGPDLLADFDLVVCGHLHKHQTYKAGGSRVVVIGSPMQLDFGDEGDERGFLVVDSETMKFEHIPLDFPQFKTIEIEAPSDLAKLPDLSNNYVHFILKTDDVMEKDLKKIKTAARPLVDHDYSIVGGSRLNLPPNAPFAKSFSAYINHVLPDAEQDVLERRLNKGLEILKKIGAKV